MSDRTEAALNLGLLVVLSGLGVATHGFIYVIYIVLACAIYYVVSNFVRPKAPSRAITAGLGCAWGSLSMVNGVLQSAPFSIGIGLMAFLIWVGPYVIRRRDG
ncbi:MAG: hypothetical protein Q8P31_08695 [Bacillota bacterium]|nr:hypothetical protein [Bacillota bacterium]